MALQTLILRHEIHSEMSLAEKIDESGEIDKKKGPNLLVWPDVGRMRKELESEMKVSTVLVIRCVKSGSLNLRKSTRKNRNKFNEQDQVFHGHVLEF